MPVVKGGVWTNIEDEILKASVSKYGLNQWARVSSLLARKTPKQCKARWTEWLDPAIRKIEWSKEEDEKLLHLAKLMPTQWRTIAPIVGRTANQCLERYSRLLDEAEAREHDELALGGPEGGETAAPTGDDVRKLRPGELDPDPESKPARPDTIDMDEDEKEMLSEARARLANTQGKKAKRKARERQLEESRRLAVLQKRRELKSAGINVKITNKKKGQMDYNADIPFEKAPASGFYDTLEEADQNEKEREEFDPRKQQLARKRQGESDDNQDNKRQKQDKGADEAKKAAVRAGALQKMREAEQQSKRRALNLPAPQVSEAELEDIVKMGMTGERASKAVGEDAPLSSRYTNMVGQTPIRTPMAPPQEDRIANSIRDIQALTNTQSSLLGGDNTPLHQGSGSTGFEGAAPTRSQLQTPNPMATPFRQQGQTGPGATPLRTPRDGLLINNQAQLDAKSALRAKLASLPKPKATEFELELPDETSEPAAAISTDREDQEEIDRRARQAAEAAAAAEFKRQTQVLQRNLPRPRTIDPKQLLANAQAIPDPIRSMIAEEAAILMSHDATHKPLPGSKLQAQPANPVEALPDDYITSARAAIHAEVGNDPTAQAVYDAHFTSLSTQPTRNQLPTSLAHVQTSAVLLPYHTAASDALLALAQENNKREKKLGLLLGGYMARQRGLKKKLADGHKALLEEREKARAFEDLRVAEDAGLQSRLEKARNEVGAVTRREREAQEEYRAVRDELDALRVDGVNGHA